jgi:RimJ/RimL family protein N-acetyltransferase
VRSCCRVADAVPGPEIETLVTPRLTLEPLLERHAAELHPLLDSPALHEFIGGRPATAEELRARYSGLETRASPDGAEGWLNWVVREREGGAAVGVMQATVRPRHALVAWVVGAPYQGRGYASEAAAGLVAWLLDQGVRDIRAHVHPDHAASGAVAARTGLAPTDERVDGEVVWRYGERNASRRSRARSAGR